MLAAKGTRTVTVNPAFLQEIKDVNQELWQLLDDVRRWCADPARLRLQRRQFVTGLGRLRDQLALHFALEEAYGYFEEPAVVAPRLCQRAGQLRAEHADLYRQLNMLFEDVEKLAYHGKLAHVAPEVAQRFCAFDQLFQSHETAENELILQVYDDDLGVGD